MKQIAVAFCASLFLVARPALACGCCADDGDFYRAPAPQLEGVLPNVQFGPGGLRDIAYDVGWKVSGISASGDEYRIHTEVGDLIFKPTRPPEHRAADITFITQPEASAESMNDVYHEVQLSGLLTLSPEAAREFEASTAEAEMLLQGRDSACFHEGSLQRWVLRADIGRDILWGLGILVVP